MPSMLEFIPVAFVYVDTDPKNWNESVRDHQRRLQNMLGATVDVELTGSKTHIEDLVYDFDWGGHHIELHEGDLLVLGTKMLLYLFQHNHQVTIYEWIPPLRFGF